MINIRAQVDVVLPIKKTPQIRYKDIPLNIGAIEITSKDKQRSFVLDSNYSDHPYKKLNKVNLWVDCRYDLINFPLSEENPYNLTIEDLESGECTASFYCSDVDCEEEYFDYENAGGTATIINNDNEKMYTLNLTLER
jgi:hypothetical protein